MSEINVSTDAVIRGVALDMDGLLFDTEKLYFETGDRILMRRGRRFCSSLQSRMMGRVGIAAVQEMVDFHGLEDSAADILGECDQVYSELLADGPDPMPGLQRWIDSLSRSGLPFGLATSSRRKFVDRILAGFDWSGRLSFVLTGDDVVNGKPHPEMYLKASEAMSIDPRHMLVLEDSGNGTRAAVAAGAITVAIPSDHTQDQDFTGAALIAKSLDDPKLLAMLAG